MWDDGRDESRQVVLDIRGSGYARGYGGRRTGLVNWVGNEGSGATTRDTLKKPVWARVPEGEWLPNKTCATLKTRAPAEWRGPMTEGDEWGQGRRRTVSTSVKAREGRIGNRAQAYALGWEPPVRKPVLLGLVVPQIEEAAEAIRARNGWTYSRRRPDLGLGGFGRTMRGIGRRRRKWE